ncbi:DUF72 domain-containing protein [Thiohalomonas denitrificans]|uniref:DUF72 domain-containing protein n=1 Tax=Thiohalomonas denitrificans TaxID=415747 RepID=A0A1G5PM98_9GAMM|nr:hypothetical protein [Thiohalomonas denitrificans]SCZ50582.1 hypothetical protein SAMN03097708_00450 [Thiohalomonas denitrificans]
MQIGAYGWDHDGWQGHFYPDDLPAEWRLGYYAGEFSAVVVPVADWIGLTPEMADEWRSDTSAEFRFYLELPGEGAPSMEPGRLSAIAAPLGERLGGLVADFGCEPPPRALLAGEWTALAPVGLIAAADCADAQVDICSSDGSRCRGPGRLALRRCTESRVEPRALREFLELLAATGAEEGLLWCGREPDVPETMHQARIVADLLGV